MPKMELVEEVMMEEDADPQAVEDDLDLLIEKDLVNIQERNETEMIQLGWKFMYMFTELGMNFETIVEEADRYTPDQVGDKIDRLKEIKDSVDSKAELTVDQRHEIIEILGDPYIRAMAEDKFGGGFIVDFGDGNEV